MGIGSSEFAPALSCSPLFMFAGRAVTQSVLSVGLSVCCALSKISDICVMCSLSLSVVCCVLVGKLSSNIVCHPVWRLLEWLD